MGLSGSNPFGIRELYTLECLMQWQSGRGQRMSMRFLLWRLQPQPTEEGRPAVSITTGPPFLQKALPSRRANKQTHAGLGAIRPSH